MNPDYVALARETGLRIHVDDLYGEHPYSFHLERAVEVLVRFGLSTPVREAAVWLHDTIEVHPDAASAALLLSLGMPSEVVVVVEAVTDEPGANRKERKAKTYPKIAKAADSVAVKLADRVANVEAGGLAKMYASEHPAFRTALYNPAHGLDALWEHLDAIIAFGAEE